MTSEGSIFSALTRSFRSRAFALADAPPDAELCALLSLGEAAAAVDRALAIELSSITTPRVRSLFQGQPTNFRTASGLSFTVDGGDIFAATVAAGHLPEARDFEAFMQLVRPGAVVVDVGANFGLYALSAVAYAVPLGRVFAFEPVPGAFAMLKRNIVANKLGATVTAMPAAVGATPTRAQFYIGDDVSFSSLHKTQRLGQADAIAVNVVSLDAALAHVSSIDLLKVDVEGGEAGVLLGAQQLLARSRAPIVQFEFSHKNLDEARLRELDEAIARLHENGFRIYRRDLEPAITLPAPEEAFSGNLFLARDGESQARLRGALTKTGSTEPRRHDLAALALLQRHVVQTRALQRSEALQREVVEVADSVVGEGVEAGASEAVRAVQRAWFEARKRALDAESRVNALSASVEGRDKLVEQNVEKIKHLRAVILALEARSGRLEGERQTLLAKTAAQRDAIAHLTQTLEGTRQRMSEAQEQYTQKGAAWRESEAKSRERIGALEAGLKKSNDKLAAVRATNMELRDRLTEVMAQSKVTQHELARVRNASKRLNERYRELQAQLGERRATSDETA